ncbi:MAG: hypothetical protein IPO81_27905 [Kouleothrix sp.]|nr:hypothetical protein [Kouleothrix sp.]
MELRLASDDPLLEELVQEAQRCGVELQQHIDDLLRGRYLLRRGESLATLLWLPGTSVAGDGAEEPDAANVGAAHDRMASAAASAWVDLLGTDDA